MYSWKGRFRYEDLYSGKSVCGIYHTGMQLQWSDLPLFAFINAYWCDALKARQGDEMALVVATCQLVALFFNSILHHF